MTPQPVPGRVVVRAVVPGQPVSKQRPRFNKKTGRAVTPQVTKNAEAWVGTFLRQAFPDVDRDHDWAVTLQFYSKDNRRRDVDNLVKLVLDAANGIIWRDDTQVTELHAYHVKGVAYPRTEIYAEVLDG